MLTKNLILESLRVYARQRPGLEFANYGNMQSYRAELRSITKDLHDAETLIGYVATRDRITAEMVLDAAKGGRLSLEERDGKCRIGYVTGQYWPTEYRPAVSRVLASAIWTYLRESMPEPLGYQAVRWGYWTQDSRRFISDEAIGPMQATREAARALCIADKAATGHGSHENEVYRVGKSTGSAGDWIRHAARQEFGASLARRWFN